MKKRLISILLTLAMILTLMPGVAFATGEEPHEHSYINGLCTCGAHNGEHTNWTVWGDDTGEQTSLPNTPGNYYLTTDVAIESTWNVPEGETHLCLNGHVIKTNTINGAFSVITINSGVTLNLYDCGTTEHYFTVGDDGFWTLTGAQTEQTRTITGGVITGGMPGGIKIYANGRLILNGGCIFGNNSISPHSYTDPTNWAGGGVYVAGTLIMPEESTATICDNIAFAGGGVFVASSGAFEFSGGTIKENQAYVAGGGVAVELGGMFKATGGAITENNAMLGGGVYVSYGTADVEGDTSLTCLAAGTPITLADGTRTNIENLKVGDSVRVFDHEAGTLSTAKLFDLWKFPEKKSGAFTLHFTNEIDVTAVGGHCFFEREENKYVDIYTYNAENYIGHEFYNADAGAWETLEGVEYLDDPVDTYIIVSEKTFNTMANGMLSNVDGLYTVLCNIFDLDDNLKIDAVKQAADIKEYGLWAYDSEHFHYVTEDTYNALNLQYLGVAIGKGLLTPEELEEAAKNTLNYNTDIVKPEMLPVDNIVEEEESEEEISVLEKILFKVLSIFAVDVYAGGSSEVYLGGDIQIIDNSNMNNARDNLSVWSEGPKINIDSNTAPKTGMSVGVTIIDSDNSTPPRPLDFYPGEIFLTGGAFTVADETYAAYAKYFTSDNPDYGVVFNRENKLELAQGEHIHDGINFKKWAETNSLPTDAGDWYLSNDVTLTETWDVPVSSAAVNLDLNGYVIKANADATTSFSAITVESGAALNLYDCNSGGKTHYYKYSSAGAWIWNEDATSEGAIIIDAIDDSTAEDTLIAISGGAITGGYAENGGGVFVETNGILTINGSAITGCTAKANGGGVYNKGVFVMNAGTIQGCIALSTASKEGLGGGVYNYHEFTLSGGTIQNNIANRFGGGVNNGDAQKTFTMSAGSIINNKANNGGGISSDGKLMISGGIISKNRAKGVGGGVRFNATSDQFIMTGGTITECTATTGGGVYYGQGNIILGGTAKIIGNTLSDGSTKNNLYLEDTTIGFATGDNIPKEGMEIGVTLKTLPTTTPIKFTIADSNINGSDYKQYFFSDNPAYLVDEVSEPTAGYVYNYYLALTGDYPLWVADTHVTFSNKDDVLEDDDGDLDNYGSVHYNPVTHVLTLDNAVLSTDTNCHENGIETELDYLTIKLIGDNKIGKVVNYNADTEYVDYSVTCGIVGAYYAQDENICCDITITGDGSLIIEDWFAGIYAKNICFDENFTGNLTVKDLGAMVGAEPTCAIRATDDVIIKSGNFDLTSYYSSGIKATGDVLITGDVDIKINDRVQGISAVNVEFDDNFTGTVKIVDQGLNEYEEHHFRCGIHATNDITINGGTFDLVSENSNGLYAANISVSGENTEVKVKGKDNSTGSPETYSIYATNAFTVAAPLEVRNGKDPSGAAYASGVNKVIKADGTNYVVIAKPIPPAPVYQEEPVYTVPVTGDKTSVQVRASISGSNATIKNITSEEIETVGTGSNVIVDLTGVPKSVTAVTIPKTTFDNVAASEADGLEIQFPNGNVTVFDKTVLTAVSDQAEGDNIKLVVDRDSKAEKSMTSEQKDTVKTLNKPVVLDAYFVSGGKRISDFKGGEAELTAVYPTDNPVRVWYVKSDGTKELIPCSYDGENAVFVVIHFSHYVIEQLDVSAYTDCPQDETCVYAHFTDADPKAWYHSGVHFCVEKKYMVGVEEHKFNPSGPLSRGMIVTMLWRMEGSPLADYEMSFNDVNSSLYYYEAIRWAQSTGVVEGYNAESFGPENNVTREQLAAILMRYASFKGIDVSARADLAQFTDANKISAWAAENVRWANATAIINGRTTTTIVPGGDSTRAEAACMVQRFCENFGLGL